MKKKISPSVMCADFFDLKNCIRQFEECKDTQSQYCHSA